MKGIISAILLIAMALSLWGCASEEKTDGTTKDTSPADDCAHLYVEDVTKSASCTENGIKTFACSLCGDSYTEDIPAAGHQEEAGKCTVCGEKNKYYKIIMRFQNTQNGKLKLPMVVYGSYLTNT